MKVSATLRLGRLLRCSREAGHTFGVSPRRRLAQNVTFLLELEKSSFVDLMTVRQALEVTAARLAATQATPEELSEIAACAHAMREVAERSGNEKDKYFDYGAKGPGSAPPHRPSVSQCPAGELPGRNPAHDHGRALRLG